MSIAVLVWSGALAAPLDIAALFEQARDPRVRVQAEAEEALVRAGTDAVAALSLNLASDSNLFARAVYARALGRIGDPAATPALIAASTNEALEVRAAVAEALGRFRHPATLAALVVLAGDPSSDVRVAALGSLRDAPGPPATDAFRRALHDRDLRVVLLALECLKQRGDPEALPDLLALAASPFTTFMVADTLPACARPSHIQLLESALGGSNRYTKGYAALLLGQLQATALSDEIADLLDDSDPALRLCAAASLLAMRRTEGVARTVEFGLTSASTPEQLAATALLARLPGPEALPLLRRACQAKEPHVRITALLSADKRTEPEAVGVLLSALADPSDDVAELARGLLYARTGRDCGRDINAWRRALKASSP